VGSPVSYSSLARDLQCSDKTVKRWLTILENMYVIIRVPPFHKNIARAIQKAPKFYFYDTGQVKSDPGMKLENTVACAIQKEIHFREDCFGEERKLYYLRNKDGKEVDFCIATNGIPSLMVEVKWRDANQSPNFEIFRKFFPQAKMVQITKELSKEKTFPNGVEIRLAHKWLAKFSLP
jgi:predicted AAA+ superfamily ATPase